MNDTGYRVLLFRGRGLISSLIRWQTRGCCSHAALMLPSGEIIEAWQGTGVRRKVLTDWTGITAYAVPSATAKQWKQAEAFARNEIGKGYDYWAIIRFISRASMPDNDRWFCSELVFAALESAGIHLLERVEASAVSPGVLAYSPLLKEQ